MGSAVPVTQLLQELRAGDASAMDGLVPLVYGELRRLADICIQRERPGHTLQPTELVHEAFLRLSGGSSSDFQNRAHFLAIAARVMRQILVDYARRRSSQKRSAALQEPLDEEHVSSVEPSGTILALDDALCSLEKRDEGKARLIELRYFGGLTLEESAEALGLSVAVVRSEQRLAQAWLGRELSGRRTSA